MARPLRIEFGGALYHVTARGDRREMIFEDDVDRERFLEVLGEVVTVFNWQCHAYCRMGDHYHLIIGTPDGNFSKGMRQLNGVFTQWSNRRRRRIGRLLGSTRLTGKGVLDFEEEVGGVSVATGHSLDDFDAVVHAFQNAGVESVDGPGDDAFDVGRQAFRKGDHRGKRAVLGQA